MGSNLVRTTDIEGITLTDLRQINDDRGSVLHMLRNDDSEFARFGECYFSEVVPGAIKAWKRHRVQTQNIAVPVGRACVVIYDNREHSSSREQLIVLELGRPDAYQRLHIPPGLWYGFSCISAIPALIANCADIPHDQEENEMLPLINSIIPYTWGKEIDNT